MIEYIDGIKHKLLLKQDFEYVYILVSYNFNLSKKLLVYSKEEEYLTWIEDNNQYNKCNDMKRDYYKNIIDILSLRPKLWANLHLIIKKYYILNKINYINSL